MVSVEGGVLLETATMVLLGFRVQVLHACLDGVVFGGLRLADVYGLRL